MTSGQLGEVLHFESHIDRFRPEVRVRWREQAVPDGGLWYDLGPHLIDQALQLFGLPERISATMATHRPGAQTNDWAVAFIEQPWGSFKQYVFNRRCCRNKGYASNPI